MTNNKAQTYLEKLPAEVKNLFEGKSYDVWNFGNDQLLKLVLQGKKIATAGLLAQHDKVPEVGDLGIITDSKDMPQCIVEYISIQTKPFLEVDFEFAQAEGEGFKDIEDWRNEHRKVFHEWSGNTFSDEALILCERFKLVYPISNI